MSRPEPSGLSVVVVGQDGAVSSVSLGELAVGGHAFEGLATEERAQLERALAESRDSREIMLVDACDEPDGRRRWKHLFVPVAGRDVVWIMRDEERAPPEAAEPSEARRWQVMLRYSTEVLTLLDRSLRVVFRSPSLERPLGYPDGLVGRSALEILHPDDRQTAMTALGKVLERPGAVASVVVRAQHAEGGFRMLHATATNLLEEPGVEALMLSYRDITEERKAEDRLLAASRLASIGTLAAGVGHEINNPLTYVLGNLDRVMELILTPGSSTDARAVLRETFELVAEARDGAQRIAKIVGDLKLLSAPERDELVAVDVDAAAERALTIVGNQLKTRANVSKKLENPPPALAAESRLVQALINLLLNAAEALPPDRADNEIEIWSRCIGDSVVVGVRDNGPGISAEDQQQIFEPYFTTKTASGGSGLGLWVVRRIAEALGGRVEVTSQLGFGATFTLTLRRAPRREPAPRVSRSSALAPVTKTGRVLVVDDDRAVAASICRTLERWHEMTMATSGYEVIERLSSGERWDVIISDLVMPGMNGLELRQRVAEMIPELGERFVLISGGAFDQHIRDGLEALGLDYLTKPPNVGELRSAVARLLR